MDEPSKPEVGIIKGGRIKHLFKSGNRKLSIVAALVFIVLVGGVVAYLVLQPTRIQPPPKADINDVSDYTEMTYDQKNYYFYGKTGLTIEHLESKKSLTEKTFKKFDYAYEAGQLFFALGNYQKAKQSYAAAVAKGVPAGNYDFYLDYAYAALLDKDKTTWKQQMLAAKDIAAKLPEPVGDEPSIAKVIDSQIKLTEAAQDE